MPTNEEKKRGPVYTRSPETGEEITEWRGACEILNRRLVAEGANPICDHTVVANLAAQGNFSGATVIHHTRFYPVAQLERLDLAQLKEYKERSAFPPEVKERARELLRAQTKRSYPKVARTLSDELGRPVSRQQVRVWNQDEEDAQQ